MQTLKMDYVRSVGKTQIHIRPKPLYDKELIYGVEKYQEYNMTEKEKEVEKMAEQLRQLRNVQKNLEGYTGA